MSSIGTGYDLAASTFSPDGRIFQVEYGQKAVDSGPTVVGVRGKDGVLLVSEQLVSSKLLIQNSHPRLHTAAEHLGLALAGQYADGVQLLDYTQGQALRWLKMYREPIPIKRLASETAEYVHIYTLGISRPFGTSAFIAAWDKTSGGHLYLVEPSGLAQEYRAWAVGRHRQAAKAELEKLKFDDLPLDELVNQIARIMISIRDEGGRDAATTRLEMGRVGEPTQGIFEHISVEKIQQAEAAARAAIEAADMEEDDE